MKVPFFWRQRTGKHSRPASIYRATPLIQLLTVLMLGAASPGCKAGEPARSASADAQGRDASADVPEDFRMVFGQGGGFTGLWEGYTVGPDGAVLSWSGRMAGEGSAPAGTLSAAQMGELWQRIEAARFFEQSVNETGNMTAFIELTAGGRTQRLSWVPGVEDLEPPRSSVEALYRYSLQTARQAEASQ